MTAASAEAAPLPGPAPEVSSADKVELPAVPDFALVSTAGDVHDVKELRVGGKPLLDTDIKVRGYVIWIYDCVAAIRTPGESAAAAQKRIDDDMTLCERAKFYLGSEKTTPPEKGLWVVDVPRAPYKMERDRLPKEQLAAWPAVPKIKVGDYVTVTGHFALQSEHKERNSDGLLVFGSLAPARPGRSSGKPVPMPLRAGPAPAIPKAPPEQPVASAARADSIRAGNEGNRLLGQKQLKEALAKYDEALKLWPGNQLAAYGAGLADIQLQQYASAKTYLDHAVDLAPDQPMFQLFAGIAAYEAKVDANRKAQGTDDPDLTNADFSEARGHLEIALALEPKLWRGHYYLGRIWRAQGAARDAAEEFTKAIEAKPIEPNPYIALGELYRKWDYSDAAIKVASAGVRNAHEQTSALYFVLGMANEDKQDETRAIDAFNLALAADARNMKAMFQRGQAYFRKKDYAKAKADLDAFVKNENGLEFARQQANKMLGDLADKK
jgi:tetratricopeptide (TPR) repeat protein